MYVKLLVAYSKQFLNKPDRPWIDLDPGEVIEVPDDRGVILVNHNQAVEVSEPPKVKKTKKGKRNGDSDR